MAFPRTLFCVFFFLCLAFKAQISNSNVFVHLNQENGYTDKVVYGIISGELNETWLLTNDGLLKSNGHSSKIYSFNNKVRSNNLNRKVINFYRDKEGIFWISLAFGGFCSFNPASELFDYYTDIPDLANNQVGIFFESKNGDFYMPMWGDGLVKFDRKKRTFKRYVSDNSKPNSLSSNELTCMIELENEKLLIGSWENSNVYKNKFLDVFDPKTEEFHSLNFKDFTYGNEKELNTLKKVLSNVRFLCPDQQGNLWIGTYMGLVKLNINKKNIKRIEGISENLNEKGIYDNLIDFVFDYVYNRLWITTEVNGLFLLDLNSDLVKKIERDADEIYGISSNYITSICIDKSGNTIVGNLNGGLDVYSPLLNQVKKQTISYLNLFKNNRRQGYKYITSLKESNNGNELYLCHGKGLTIFNLKTNSCKYVVVDKSKPDIYQSYEPGALLNVIEKKDFLILITKGALFKYDKKTENVSAINLSNGIDNMVTGDFSNEILSTSGKCNTHPQSKNCFMFYLLDTNNFSVKENLGQIHDVKYIPDDYNIKIYTRQVNKKNWLIYTRFDEFYILNSETKQIKQLKSTDFGNAGSVIPVCQNKDGKVYFISDKSFFQFDSQKNSTLLYPVNFDFDYKLRRGYNVDTANTLWYIANNTINSFNLKSKEYRNYFSGSTINFGLSTSVFNNLNKSGNIYFPTTEGLIYFNPYKLSGQLEQPKLYISDISINSKELSETQRSKFVAAETTLNYHQNNLQFEFASNQTYFPGTKHYFYRLIGFDSVWHTEVNKNYVSYSNLPKGNYILQVKYTNSWLQKSNLINIPFVIKAPYWQTNWFYAFVIVSYIFLTFMVIRYIIKRRINKQRKISALLLNAQEDERQRISRELHDNIGQRLLSLNIKTKNQHVDEINPLIEEVRSLSRTITPVKFKDTGLKELIIRLIDDLKEQQIYFTYDIEEIIIANVNFKMNVFRIIQESISNIIKHSKASNARIVIFKTDKGFKVEINDDGQGFDLEQYLLNNSVGLSSIHERALVIGAELVIKSGINGTKIELVCNETNYKNSGS
ncbi:MAG: triple tyrosine motif-containing protein [Bacteroidota bacterium]|nr:triple tyrosine motif-containing protein [Bacteroidota bacterium]